MNGFAYGDAVNTGDDKYVLAQFRHDAMLAWVADLRSFLHLPELKYRDYQPRREQVNANRELSKRVSAGLQQAEITIIDLPMYQHLTIAELIDEGAEAGLDFDLTIVNNKTARRMISESPIGRLRHLDDGLVDLPFTYFNDGHRPAPAPAERPSEIHARAGGKMRDAVVLAARAHSMLTPSETMEVILAFGGSPHGPANLASALEIVRSMGRAYDVEHPKSLPILNELADRVARAANMPALVVSRDRPQVVSEEDSRTSDHLQAADMAAGWAADLLLTNRGDYRGLAKQVRWVGVNGIGVPG